MPTGAVLGWLLRTSGVDAVYGEPLRGLAVVPVAGAVVARLLAAAHRRVHARPAGVHIGNGTVVVGDGPVTGTCIVESTTDLSELVTALSAVAPGSAVELRLGADPPGAAVGGVPPAATAPRWAEPDDGVLAAVRAARAPVVLAGPGVGSAGAVPGLHALAAAASLGVLNTWGAKGIFDWRSRHHLATAGLQASDFELGGLADADLIIATGLDPAEAPPGRWRLAPSVEVAPDALGPLAEQWSRPRRSIAVPELRTGLAHVTQDGWASWAVPLAPSRVTRHYGEAVGPGGLVAADPGVAGYWVARTFATTRLGTVLVPARQPDGFAAACATVARLSRPSRPSLVVVDGPADPMVQQVLDAAASLGVALAVEAWEPDGDALGADEHLARLRSLVHVDRPTTVSLATDQGQLARMIEVAGPVVAWEEGHIA